MGCLFSKVFQGLIRRLSPINKNTRTLFLKFTRYSLVGFICICFYFAFMFVLVEFFRKEPVFSSVLSFLFMTVLSYILNKRFTFNATFSKRSLIRYSITSLMGAVLNVFIMYVVIYILLSTYIVGEIIATLIVPVLNFFLNNFWTFATAVEREGVN